MPQIVHRCQVCQTVDRTAFWDSMTTKCRPCYNEWRREYRARKRAAAHEIKAVPCADCGVQYPPYVMDFDHLSDKDFNIMSTGLSDKSYADFMAEIDKCEVVCANCHRERTFNRALTRSVV